MSLSSDLSDLFDKWLNLLNDLFTNSLARFAQMCSLIMQLITVAILYVVIVIMCLYVHALKNYFHTQSDTHYYHVSTIASLHSIACTEMLEISSMDRMSLSSAYQVLHIHSCTQLQIFIHGCLNTER